MTAQSLYRTDDDNLAYVDFVVRYEKSVSDATAGVIRLPIAAGRTVLGVRCRTMTVFNGTTPTLSVGDSASATGYLTTTDLDVTVLNSHANSGGLGTNTYAKGKYYAAADAVKLTIAGAGVTTGKVSVEILFSGYTGPATADLVK